MGLMDKVKGLLKGREKQVKSGIDTVSDQVEQRAGPKHAGKVDDISDKAKDAVDKLGSARRRHRAGRRRPRLHRPAAAPARRRRRPPTRRPRQPATRRPDPDATEGRTPVRPSVIG